MSWHIGSCQLDRRAPACAPAFTVSGTGDLVLPPPPSTGALVQFTFTKAAVQKVGSFCGKTFSMDAYAKLGGRKAHARQYYDADHPFLASHIADKHIWLAPPQLLVKQSIQHYLSCKSAAPDTTSACIAVPHLQRHPGCICLMA